MKRGVEIGNTNKAIWKVYLVLYYSHVTWFVNVPERELAEEHRIPWDLTWASYFHIFALK